MDTIRDGQFGLSNTNKLIRFYEGANGIKTGSTSIAKYCLSASAKRNNMQLIAVVLGAPSTADRFSSASKLLDYGFANYAIADNSSYDAKLPQIKVKGGTAESVDSEILGSLSTVVRKGNQNKITVKVKTEDVMSAPIKKGDKVGEATFYIDGEVLTKKDVVAKNDVPEVTFLQMFGKCLKKWITLQ